MAQILLPVGAQRLAGRARSLTLALSVASL
jgi:hypothetical protein